MSTELRCGVGKSLAGPHWRETFCKNGSFFWRKKRRFGSERSRGERNNGSFHHFTKPKKENQHVSLLLIAAKAQKNVFDQLNSITIKIIIVITNNYCGDYQGRFSSSCSIRSFLNARPVRIKTKLCGFCPRKKSLKSKVDSLRECASRIRFINVTRDFSWSSNGGGWSELEPGDTLGDALFWECGSSCTDSLFPSSVGGRLVAGFALRRRSSLVHTK